MTSPPFIPNVEQLFSQGSPGAFGRDKPVGYSVEGEIVDIQSRQRTDLDGKPQTWDNGDPQIQLAIVLQTTLRDHAEDDGKRRTYIPTYGQNWKNFQAAVRKAGAEYPKTGGRLRDTFDHEEPSTRRGYDPLKVHVFVYEPPNPAVDLFRRNGDQAAPQAHGYQAGAYASPPPVPPSEPVDVTAIAQGPAQLPFAAPPEEPAPSDQRIAAIRALAAAGQTPQQISNVFPDFSAAAIAAALAIQAAIQA